MPIHEYRCSACGFGQEVLQKISARPLKVCPSCGKKKFTKLISAAGFQLKGTGWYATDFKNNAPKPKKDPKQKKTEDKPAAPCGTGACPTCQSSS